MSVQTNYFMLLSFSVIIFIKNKLILFECISRVINCFLADYERIERQAPDT